MSMPFIIIRVKNMVGFALWIFQTNWRASEASEMLFSHVYEILIYIYIIRMYVSNTHARMMFCE